jgi:hypothetical protein
LAGKFAGQILRKRSMNNDPIESLTLKLPEKLLYRIGFRAGDIGTHTSRTISIEDITNLFKQCPASASSDNYEDAIVNQNCLAKRTKSTRKGTFQRLSELYGLNPKIPIFRMYRQFWDMDNEAKPLLAILVGLARDPLLRFTAPLILRMRPNEELSRQQMTSIIAQNTGDRFNEATLDKVVRNVSSSWTQSGHLSGRVRKIRTRVKASPAVTTFAIFLAYSLGIRGKPLFDSFWAQILDSHPEDLIYQAMDARRLGYLDMSQSGGVLDISFSRILTDEERILLNVTN